MKSCSVIIPTFNNLNYLSNCVGSILNNTFHTELAVMIVNNGDKGIIQYFKHPSLFFLQNKDNVGWEKALNQGIENSKTDYVLFLNDDTYILPHNYAWLQNMQSIMEKDETIGAVGPCSNVVMGYQNMCSGLTFRNPNIEVPYLIGFCMLVRRSAIDKIGLIDDSLSGGDDLDYSIRLRLAGYKLIAKRNVFVYHHGFKTGERVHKSYWNSVDMTEKTNIDLIRKHGFKEHFKLFNTPPIEYITDKFYKNEDECLLSICQGKGVEIGCGGKKIVDDVIGVDLVKKGDVVPIVNTTPILSVADIVADGSDLNMFQDNEFDYLVSRHNLEHYIDPIKALQEWKRVLKQGGKIGIIVPDESKIPSIKLDDTHRHTYTQESLKSMLEILGFKVIEQGISIADWSIFCIGEKI